MKTENTLENKAKFFANYWKQKICWDNAGIANEPWLNYNWGEIDKLHLELTPLSQITEDDLKHLSKIDLVSSGEYDDTVTDLDLIKFGQFEFLNSERDLKYLLPEAVDFIRSKGYALPWMDLSVEDLVEYGWVKLKSEL